MANDTLLVRDALLVDGTGAPPVDHANVLIRGGRIEDISTGSPASAGEARVIDARGRTLLPGLMDLHVHVTGSAGAGGWMWPLFRRFGVTTVRDVGGDPDTVMPLRERERRGDAELPRIFCYGPLLDGKPALWGTSGMSRELTSVEEARAVASELIDRGVDGLKVYLRLPLDLMSAVLEIARARDIPVAGHVSVVPAAVAVELGLSSLEHVSGVRPPLDDAAIDQLAQRIVTRGTCLVPTITIQEQDANWVDDPTPPAFAELAEVPADVRTRWDERLHSPRGREQRALYYNWQIVNAREQLLQAVHAVGGRVAVGSDTPNPFVIPGLSVHLELARLVALGFSPIQAIAAATGRAAELLRRPDLGVIAPGKLADVVLVEGNVVQDIRTTQQVRVVVKSGNVVHEAE